MPPRSGAATGSARPLNHLARLEAELAAEIIKQRRRPRYPPHTIVLIKLDDDSPIFPDEDDILDRCSSNREHSAVGWSETCIDFRAGHSRSNPFWTRRQPTGNAEQHEHSEQCEQE